MKAQKKLQLAVAPASSRVVFVFPEPPIFTSSAVQAHALRVDVAC